MNMTARGSFLLARSFDMSWSTLLAVNERIFIIIADLHALTHRQLTMSQAVRAFFFPLPLAFVPLITATTTAVVLQRTTSPSGAVPVLDPALRLLYAYLVRVLPPSFFPPAGTASSLVGSATSAAGIAAALLSVLWLLLARVLSGFFMRWLLRSYFRAMMNRDASASTKIKGVLVAHVFPAIKRPTDANQTVLPRLPVPALEDTVRRTLESLQAVASEAQHRELTELAQDFLKDPATLKAQRALTARSWTRNHYVGDWWLKCVYLRGRGKLPIDSNYHCLTLDMDPAALGTTRPCARAACYLRTWIQTALDLESGAFDAQIAGGGVPLCMNQYLDPTPAGLCLTRVPKKDCDELVAYDLGTTSRHVVVMRKNAFAVVENVLDTSGRLCTMRQLETALEQARALCDAAAAAAAEQGTPLPAVADLTAMSRDQWAEVREWLRTDPRHHQESAATLALIEGAIMVIAMDDRTDIAWNDLSALCQSTLCGVTAGSSRVFSRWYDKSITLIVDDAANVTFNGEHSYADAPMVAHVLDDCMQVECESAPYDAADGHCRADASTKAAAAAPSARAIRFAPCEKLLRTTQEATAAALAAGKDLHLDVRRNICGFGKSFISRVGKLSPDAFFQMALQGAYNRCRPDGDPAKGGDGDAVRLCHTYESAMHRAFLEGRTETIRSATSEALEWVRVFNRTHQARTSGATPDAAASAECARALFAACKQHGVVTNRAMTGDGVDRHLFALYVCCFGLGVQAPAFLQRVMTSFKWLLSTSQVPTGQSTRWKAKDHLSRFPRQNGGFGHVTTNGYGVSYAFSSDNVIVAHVASSRGCSTTDSAKLQDALQQVLVEMQQIVNTTAAAARS